MKKGINCSILFAAQDPGGFYALLPVMQAMRNTSAYRLKFLMAKNAVGLARAAKFRPVDGSHLNAEKIAEELFSFAPDIIVTGTSGGPCIENMVTAIAKREHIPIVSILDFWINYRARFHDMPDYILVMDKTAKQEMIADGFPAEKLVITGNPYFDTFKKLSAPKSKKLVIAFIDQPFAAAVKSGWGTDYGFDEFVVLRDLFEVLRTLRFDGEVLIKLHPKTTDKNKFDAFIAHAGVRVRFAGVREDVLKKAHIIFGMTSPLLIAAAVGGKPAVSYEPNLTFADPLVSNRWGLTFAPRSIAELRRILAALIAHPRPPKNSKNIARRHIVPNATTRVTMFIKKLCRFVNVRPGEQKNNS